MEIKRYRNRAIPSWPDWLVARIEALPGPGWLAYVVLFVILSVLGVAVRWVDGDVPVATIDMTAVLECSFPAVFLGAYAWLNRLALRSLDTLRPAITVAESRISEIAHDLVRTPAGWALIAIPLGALSSFLSIGDNPEGYGLRPGVGPIMVTWEYGLSIVTQAIVIAFAIRTIHQLSVVSRIHSEMVRVDLFRLDPLYAFANLTAWTGTAILAMMGYGVGALVIVSAVTYSIVDFVVFLAFMALAVASFVLPLLGLHGHIQEEKDRRKAEAGAVLEAAVAEVESRIKSGRYEMMSEVNDGLAAATSTFNTISRVSTWPWRPDTIRGFVGALGLPVLIYAITAFLSRFI